MLRLGLESEFSRRRFLLLLLAGLVISLSGAAEYHHRRADLAEMDVTAKTLTLLPAIVLNTLPALVALAVIPWIASRFNHALYDTKDLRQARRFFRRNVFGMSAFRPLLIVKEGRVAVGAGSLCDRTGGRGLLVVYNDSAVVLERGGRLTRVAGPYFGFLERFERVWETIDLRPQRRLCTVDAMTKEGIPIACGADITFKIDDRFADPRGNVQTKPPHQKSPIDTRTGLITDAAITTALGEAGIEVPLPYTEDAAFKAATSISVRTREQDHPEQLRRWTGHVMYRVVERTLRSILARYRIDWLMSPPQPGDKYPREEIRELLEHRLRLALPVGNALGARIIHVDLGQITVKDERIPRQWIDAWQATWEQRAVEKRAEGEAELARLEAAQVQAQAEMVLTLTETIRSLVTSESELSSYQLSMRFIETLRWMSYDPWRRVLLPPEATRRLKELERMLNNREDPPPREPPPGFGPVAL